MIQFNCEQCGKDISVEDRYSGKSGKCKQCGAAIVVPVTESIAESGFEPESEEPEEHKVVPSYFSSVKIHVVSYVSNWTDNWNDTKLVISIFLGLFFLVAGFFAAAFIWSHRPPLNIVLILLLAFSLVILISFIVAIRRKSIKHYKSQHRRKYENSEWVPPPLEQNRPTSMRKSRIVNDFDDDEIAPRGRRYYDGPPQIVIQNINSNTNQNINTNKNRSTSGCLGCLLLILLGPIACLALCSGVATMSVPTSSNLPTEGLRDKTTTTNTFDSRKTIPSSKKEQVREPKSKPTAE